MPPPLKGVWVQVLCMERNCQQYTRYSGNVSNFKKKHDGHKMMKVEQYQNELFSCSSVDFIKFIKNCNRDEYYANMEKLVKKQMDRLQELLSGLKECLNSICITDLKHFMKGILEQEHNELLNSSRRQVCYIMSLKNLSEEIMKISSSECLDLVDELRKDLNIKAQEIPIPPTPTYEAQEQLKNGLKKYDDESEIHINKVIKTNPDSQLELLKIRKNEETINKLKQMYESLRVCGCGRKFMIEKNFRKHWRHCQSQ